MDAHPFDRENIPPLIYGTAWKETATEPHTSAALACGYRAIDTANQRKHYYEEGVGRAVAAFLAAGHARREELFLQTKFTFAAGQDTRLPYDPQAPVGEQVRQSCASSLAHLQTEYLDSFVLHGPSVRYGLGRADEEAWRAMEELHDHGRTRALGVSNVTVDQLRRLYELARIKPRFVQNRCFAHTGWDREVRAFCREKGIFYQGFSLLTANTQVFSLAEVRAAAARLGVTEAQVIFRFALDVGMIPLTGTTDARHMKEDLLAAQLPPLTGEERRAMESVGR